MVANLGEMILFVWDLIWFGCSIGALIFVIGVVYLIASAVLGWIFVE